MPVCEWLVDLLVDTRVFQQRVPGAAGQPNVTIERAAHFFQEDGAVQLAQVLIDAIGR